MALAKARMACKKRGFRNVPWVTTRGKESARVGRLIDEEMSSAKLPVIVKHTVNRVRVAYTWMSL
jgi:hypothetical protein